MSDYYLEQEDPFDPDDTYWRGKSEPEDGDGPPLMQRVKPTKTVWVTKSGQRIKVRDMTDSHLVNTIRYLRRHAEISITQYLHAAYSMEGYLSGEMAQVFIAQDIDMLEEADADEMLSDAVPCWETMLDEVEKRKLTI